MKSNIKHTAKLNNWQNKVTCVISENTDYKLLRVYTFANLRKVVDMFKQQRQILHSNKYKLLCFIYKTDDNKQFYHNSQN